VHLFVTWKGNLSHPLDKNPGFEFGLGFAGISEENARLNGVFIDEFA
jgi:hypothetical protein